MARTQLHHHAAAMKQNKFSQHQSHQLSAESLKQNEIAFVPSADEVARRAYFSYLNQGSPRGHEVQHWLVAEAELIAERNLTRVHTTRHQA